MQKRHAIFAAITGVSLLVAGASPVAAATTSPRLTDLVQRGESGTLTAQDRTYLDRHADLASLVPDATKTVVGTTPMTRGDHLRVAEGLRSALAASTCAGSNRYQIHKSYTGGTIFEYHSYVRWCWTSSSTTVTEHYPYLAKASSIVYNRATLINTVRSLSSTSKQTDHQNRVELCTLKYGCYASLYPHNRVTVKNSTGSSFWHDI